MRILARILIAIVAVVVVAVVILYAGSEWVIRKGHAVPDVQVAVPTDAAAIAEGARLARIASCRDCHGANGEGKILFDVPMLARVAPPSLAQRAAQMTDAELARAVRHGVKKDGSTLFIMPTHALGHIADDDLGRIIAWMRSLKPGPHDSTATTAYRPLGRALILFGALPAQANSAAVAAPKRPADTGRYFVDVACKACHLLDKETTMEDGSTKVPALAPMAASYDPAKFRTLLRTGVGTKPDHGLMTEVARASLAWLSDDEIAAVQAYLKGEAEKMPAE